MFRHPFEFQGRIRRREYCISVFLFMLFLSFAEAFQLNGISSIQTLGSILLFVCFWFIIAQGTKRCHDRGESGLWQLIPFYFLILFLVMVNHIQINMDQIQRVGICMNMETSTFQDEFFSKKNHMNKKNIF